MKVTKFSKKLRFTKETVANLNSNEMNAALAGMYALPDTTVVFTVTACQTQCPSGGLPCKLC